MSNFLSKDYWETRWQQSQTGWDLNKASAPLIEIATSIPLEQRAGKLLIPGCGNGWEALELLKMGFSNITMLDIAPTAVENMRQRLDTAFPNWQEKLHLVCADFFQHEGSYDLILEQTFFCALDPSLRPAYVQKMKALLKPNGCLTGVLFGVAFDNNPPFGGSESVYRLLFEKAFWIERLEPCLTSIPARMGTELVFSCKTINHPLSPL